MPRTANEPLPHLPVRAALSLDLPVHAHRVDAALLDHTRRRARAQVGLTSDAPPCAGANGHSSAGGHAAGESGDGGRSCLRCTFATIARQRLHDIADLGLVVVLLAVCVELGAWLGGAS